MALSLRKPILVGGVSVSVALWLWMSLQHSIIAMGEWVFWGTLALGTCFWLFRPGAKQTPVAVELVPINQEMVTEAIKQGEAMLTYLEAEATEQDLSEFKQKLQQLPESLQRKQLQIVISGAKGVGKTALHQLLANQEIVSEVDWVETLALDAAEAETAKIAQEVCQAGDLVLLVVNGDLSDSQLSAVRSLQQLRQRILLVLNKQDQYPQMDRALLLQQLRHRVEGILAPEDVVSVSAQPQQVKVRKHQEDGSTQEWLEQPEPQVEQLITRLQPILSQQQDQLVWSTTWREAVALQRQGKEILNHSRRDRALPIIERYQWIAAASAFANPVPALDLLATAAVSAQIVADLGAIYQQKFSLEQAQTASGTIGKLMLQLGLVEFSTQTLGTMLKSNALTYAAGGTVQGVSAAYLTRLAGLCLVEYFQEQDIQTTTSGGFNFERLGQKLKQVFEQNQRAAFLQGFVKQAVAKLA